MSNSIVKTATLAAMAATVLATSAVAPAQAAGPASIEITNAAFQSDDANIVLVGGKHGHHKFRKHGWRKKHGRHFYGHGHGYYNPYYGGCQWRKKRFWDGYGYYYKNVRVCF